ncbi:MAG: hypothetical protein J6X33_00730 [Clostridiales bacterium]|nr:hypothetical protein [Clostridiales bacterium]
MTPSHIIAVTFNVIALAVLLFFIIYKMKSDLAKYKNYFVASSAVYLSGTVLITVIIFVAQKIPLMFAIFSEVMILFVFAVSLFVMYKSAKTIVELNAQAKAGKMRSAEQVKAEDEAFYGKDEEEGEEEDK